MSLPAFENFLVSLSMAGMLGLALAVLNEWARKRLREAKGRRVSHGFA